MIAVDTNILLYAHREDDARHDRASAALTSLVAEGRRWAVPWPCLHEFLAVATHPRVFSPPSTPGQAVEAVRHLLDLPRFSVLAESSEHFEILARLIGAAEVRGPRVHDARVAAICLGHEVAELWTADRDFSLFPGLRTRNPMADRLED